MSNEEIFVATALGVWKSTYQRADKFFSSLSEVELQKQVAPGKNRLIYLLGHLTALHDRTFALLGFGERSHPELDAIFVTTPDQASELPSLDAVWAAWSDVNGRLNEAMAKLTVTDWLAKHTAVSDEDFAKEPLRNRFSILVTRTNHLSYHLGQVALVPK
jgi:hypothetical protein